MASRNAEKIGKLRAQVRGERVHGVQRSKTLRTIIALVIEDDDPAPADRRRRMPRAVVLR